MIKIQGERKPQWLVPSMGLRNSNGSENHMREVPRIVMLNFLNDEETIIYKKSIFVSGYKLWK